MNDQHYESEERQYLELLEDIIKNGTDSEDRTGIGTKKIFCNQMRFSLNNQFPILTTKKVYWKGVVEELLWFIRGETDSKKLEKEKVFIWKDNTTREFLNGRGLDYPEGEIGPGYGFQWRNFGGTYKCFNNLWGEKMIDKAQTGVDQLERVIDEIKTNPNSRRLVVSAWNPQQIDRMALPPCHMTFQFQVEDDYKLNCHLLQRSADCFLGIPFNISSYALLTYVIAEIVGLEPGCFVITGVDCHIYKNHIEQVKTQLKRIPYPFPRLKIHKNIKSLKDIEELQYEDLELINYKYHPTIKAPMAI